MQPLLVFPCVLFIFNEIVANSMKEDILSGSHVTYNMSELDLLVYLMADIFSSFKEYIVSCFFLAMQNCKLKPFGILDEKFWIG